MPFGLIGVGLMVAIVVASVPLVERAMLFARATRVPVTITRAGPDMLATAIISGRRPSKGYFPDVGYEYIDNTGQLRSSNRYTLDEPFMRKETASALASTYKAGHTVNAYLFAQGSEPVMLVRATSPRRMLTLQLLMVGLGLCVLSVLSASRRVCTSEPLARDIFVAAIMQGLGMTAAWFVYMSVHEVTTDPLPQVLMVALTAVPGVLVLYGIRRATG